MQRILKHKIKKSIDTYKVENFTIPLEILTGFIMGFIISRLTFFNAPFVFGLSYLFIAGFKSRVFFFFSFLGVFTSYFILPSGTAEFTAVFSLIIFALICFFREKDLFKSIKRKIYFYLILFFCVFEVSLFVYFNKSFGLVFFILLIVNVITGVFSFMIFDYVLLKEKGISYEIFSKADIDKIIYGFFFLIIFASLFNIEIVGISLGNVLLYALLLNIVMTQSLENTVLYGLIIGLCAGVLQKESSYLISVMPLSCLFSGLLKRQNKYLGFSAFLLSNIILGTFYKAYFSDLSALYEVILGLLIYFIIPSFFKEKLSSLFSSIIPEKEKDNSVTNNNFIAKKLENISAVFNRLAIAVKDEKGGEDIAFYKDKILESCVLNICNNCSMQVFCHNKSYNETKNHFDEIVEKLFKAGEIGRTDFSKKCVNYNKIKNKIYEYYNLYLNNKKIEENKENSKSMLKSQFENMSRIFYVTAQNIKENITFDSNAEKKAIELFKEKNLDISELSIYKDEEGRYFSEFNINIRNCPTFLIEKATEIIEFSVGCVFSVVGTSQFDNRTFLKLGEKERLVIESFIYQKNKQNEVICGDSVDSFRHSSGKKYFLLSDGMGSGIKAKEISEKCIEIFRELILADFSFEKSVEMLNTSLKINTSDDIFTTIDFLEFDLYDGKGTIIKSGSAPTYILRNNNLKEFNTKTLPCGIMEEIQYDKISFDFMVYDIIIMVSDGVLSSDKNKVIDILTKQDYKDFKKAKENILSHYENIFKDNDDDITVMVLKVKEN